MQQPRCNQRQQHLAHTSIKKQSIFHHHKINGQTARKNSEAAVIGEKR